MPLLTAERNPVRFVGAKVLDFAGYLGGMSLLLLEAVRWTLLGAFSRRTRFGWGLLAAQVVRVGVRAVGIVTMGLFFIGLILALQLAPQFEKFQMLSLLSYTIGYIVLREMGPLISGVVLSGFAGASIAAEIGTMVVSEEIEALEAHAIAPVRFLVVPRVLATTIMLVLLCVLADLAGCLGGYVTSILVLGPDAYQGYWGRIPDMGVRPTDFFIGLGKAAVFGLLISLIACFEGLRVRGGAEGVGRATTMTVVNSIVSLIIVDVIFTIIFFAFEGV